MIITAVVLAILFSIAMLAIGAACAKRSRTYDDFLVAGREEGVFATTCSILATAIGASATVGLMDQAASKGFPFFWFLGAAAIGLLFQGLTVAGSIRRTGARTFSEVVKRQFGPRVHRVVSILIVLGWTAIIAAQFKAAGTLAQSMSGSIIGYKTGVILSAALIVFYTLPGGQRAVIVTDMVQFGMIIAGMSGLLIFMLLKAPHALAKATFPLFNEHFTMIDWLHHLLIVGGIYVISPNLFSRCFAAKDERTSRNAVIASAPVLAMFGAVIAFIGVYAAASGMVKPGGQVFSALSGTAGFPWNVLLGLSIFAAIVSSADTTLFVTASIAQHDLLRRESVKGVRAWVGGLALAAALLVLLAPDATLYSFLFAAYNIFAPAVVPLVFAAFYAPCGMAPGFVWSGLSVGVCAGVYGYVVPVIKKISSGFEPVPETMVLSAGFVIASCIAAAGVFHARRSAAAAKGFESLRQR